MDRTAEFFSLVTTSQKDECLVEKRKFYEDIYAEVVDIQERISRATSYKTLVELDRALNSLVKKSTEVLDGVKMAGGEDLEMHFEGVKQIINKKFVEVSKALVSKRTKATMNVELEPERPSTFKRVVENQLLEQESRNITESVQYEATRQRLMKIEAIQKAIHQNLLMQDERIDNVCISHGSTTDIYKALSAEDGIGSGSFFKRATTTIIVCLTAVLLFVHIFYRVGPNTKKRAYYYEHGRVRDVML